MFDFSHEVAHSITGDTCASKAFCVHLLACRLRDGCFRHEVACSIIGDICASKAFCVHLLACRLRDGCFRYEVARSIIGDICASNAFLCAFTCFLIHSTILCAHSIGKNSTTPISQHLATSMRVFQPILVNYSNNNTYFTAFGINYEGVSTRSCKLQQWQHLFQSIWQKLWGCFNSFLSITVMTTPILSIWQHIWGCFNLFLSITAMTTPISQHLAKIMSVSTHSCQLQQWQHLFWAFGNTYEGVSTPFLSITAMTMAISHNFLTIGTPLWIHILHMSHFNLIFQAHHTVLLQKLHAYIFSTFLSLILNQLLSKLTSLM